MTLEAAKILAPYIDESEIRETYSGRGMFGGSTTGLVVPDLHSFYAGLADWLQELDTENEEVDYIAELLYNLKTDAMGRDLIIY